MKLYSSDEGGLESALGAITKEGKLFGGFKMILMPCVGKIPSWFTRGTEPVETFLMLVASEGKWERWEVSVENGTEHRVRLLGAG